MTAETDRKRAPSREGALSKPAEEPVADHGTAAADGPSGPSAATPAGTTTSRSDSATAPPASEPATADTHEAADGSEQVSLDLDELAATAAERDEYLALAQRTQADFENYRKRVARDAAQAELRGIVRLAKELLPGLDNLDRALAAEDDQAAQFAEGVRLVQAELIAALSRVGLEAYSPQGERFDPELHEAMAQQPADQGVESGTIIEVYQPGYRIEGVVIRPARVVVAA